jgi:hypothetical protein
MLPSPTLGEGLGVREEAKTYSRGIGVRPLADTGENCAVFDSWANAYYGDMGQNMAGLGFLVCAILQKCGRRGDRPTPLKSPQIYPSQSGAGTASALAKFQCGLVLW